MNSFYVFHHLIQSGWCSPNSIFCSLLIIWGMTPGLIYSKNLILKTELLIFLWLLLWGSSPQDPRDSQTFTHLLPEQRDAVTLADLSEKQSRGGWKIGFRGTQYETHALILAAVGNDSLCCKSVSKILPDTWKMRNAKLMPCRKSLASVTKDGLNKHQDKSESNSTNLTKRPSILVLQPSFSSLLSPFPCFESTESRTESVSFFQDIRSQSRPSFHRVRQKAAKNAGSTQANKICMNTT